MIFFRFHTILILPPPKCIKIRIHLRQNYDNFHIRSKQFLFSFPFVFRNHSPGKNNWYGLGQMSYYIWDQVNPQNPYPKNKYRGYLNIYFYKLHVKARVWVSPQLTYNTFLFINLVISLGINSISTPPCPKEPYSLTP